MKQCTMLFALVVAFLALGCYESEVKVDDNDDKGPKVNNIDQGECKDNTTQIMAKIASDADSGDAVLPITATVNDKTVTVKHTNAYYQCGADIIFNLEAKDKTIILTEIDTSNAQADCMCLMDLSLDIENLSDGIYKIEVWSQHHDVLFGRISVTVGDCDPICDTDQDCLDLNLPAPYRCPGTWACLEGQCNYQCQTDPNQCKTDADCESGYFCNYTYPEPGYPTDPTKPLPLEEGETSGNSSNSQTAPDEKPPVGVTCDSDADCPEGSLCTKSQYLCPPDMDCDYINVCMPENDAPPTPEFGTCEPRGNHCTKDSDCEMLLGKPCPNGYMACENNICVAHCDGNDCYSDSDCPKGSYCDGPYPGQPTDPDKPLDTDGNTSSKTPECNGSSATTVAPAGICVPKADACGDLGGQCFGFVEGQFDCPKGFTSPYTDHSQLPLCGVGAICCVPETPMCKTDEDCMVVYDDPATGMPYQNTKCINGQCVYDCDHYTCASDDECGPNAKCHFRKTCDSNGNCCGSSICVKDTDPCVCNEIYSPVCGHDGVTYDNECFANCKGAKVVYKGECEDCPTAPAECKPGYKMECKPSKDSWCMICECVPIGTVPGYCSSTSDCKDYEYCSVDDGDCMSNPYCKPNEPCDTSCYGVCKEIPTPACDCPAVWSPICGADGKTYGNKCELECANMKQAYSGECATYCNNDKDCRSDQYCDQCPPKINCPECSSCGKPRCMPYIYE